MKRLYLALAVLGTVLPFTAYASWTANHGLDPLAFLAGPFVNGAGTMFALDLIVAAATALVFMAIEGRRLGVRPLWLPLGGTFLVGLSFGLPVFLYLRQRALEARA